MGELTFIHAADVHLGRPFSGLRKSDPELASLFVSAGYRAWERLVAAAIDREVDFVTLGGDTFDVWYPTIRARVAFKDGIERLHSAGIPVFMALGNHDPLAGFPETLTALAGLHIFQEKVQGKSIGRAEFTQGAVIFGASFAKPEVSDNLVRTFRRDPGIEIAIGVIHANVGGVGGHKNYAPCSVDDLVVSGMDAWCLGHIHAGGILRDDPLILYSGAAQGSNINESGRKGGYLVAVKGRAAPQAEFVPLGSVLWDTVEIDVSDVTGADDFLGIAEEACSQATGTDPGLEAAVLRIGLQGSPSTSVSELITREAQELLAERLADLPVPVVLDGVCDWTTDSFDIEALHNEEGFLGEFIRMCRKVQSDAAAIEKMAGEICADLSRKVPSRYVGEQIDPSRLATDPETLAGTMNRVARQVAQMFIRSKIS
ncbi:MAG: DNA repair exonuclease [Desulfomonile tiedjei]|nr:DNA repair exonuclease [Desulfomonile tiedjei]